MAAIDVAIAEREAADAQHEATHRALLDRHDLHEGLGRRGEGLARDTPDVHTARALATMMSTWKAAKKDQVLAQRDEAQRAMSDVVAEQDAGVAAKELAVTAKELAGAEHEAARASAAKEASEAALVIMTAERDAAVSEEEAVGSKKEEAKTAQNEIKELKRANDHFMNSNANVKLQREIIKIWTMCNNFKNLNIVRRDRDEWKDAHDSQVYEVAAKAATLLRAELDIGDSVRTLEEKEKLAIQLAAQIAELELGCKGLSDRDNILSTYAQRHTPGLPASLGVEHGTADEAATKKASKGKFQLPSILIRRSPAVAHVRVGFPFIDVDGQHVDDLPEELARAEHSHSGSRSSTTPMLQRDSIASSLG
ncbi:hypothetical protein V8D89_009469 [Ganoderma adspersum]